MAFGFFDEINQEYVEMDPRIGTIQLLNGLGSVDLYDSVITETREIALKQTSAEKFPEFYIPGSTFNYFKGSSNLQTIYRSENVYLKDNLERVGTNKLLVMKIQRCIQETLPQGEQCEQQDDVETFFETHTFAIMVLKNYVDF